MVQRTKKLCSVDGCENSGKLRRGWCDKHYKRWQVHGDPNHTTREPRNKDKTCSITGCGSTVTALNMCNKHYRRHLKKTNPRCFVQGCDKTTIAKDMCSKHLTRWMKYGDVKAGGRKYRSPEDRFNARTEWQGDCLVWTGSKCPAGYGSMWLDGQHVKPHRYIWEKANGPIPDDMQIDHICWNTSCCNVRHLRLATREENNAYRSGRGRKSATGYRNVYKHDNKFVAKVKKEGVSHYLGTFETVEAAAKAAAEARRDLFGEFAGSS